jgi:hypothetical protein
VHVDDSAKVAWTTRVPVIRTEVLLPDQAQQQQRTIPTDISWEGGHSMAVSEWNKVIVKVLNPHILQWLPQCWLHGRALHARSSCSVHYTVIHTTAKDRNDVQDVPLTLYLFVCFKQILKHAGLNSSPTGLNSFTAWNMVRRLSMIHTTGSALLLQKVLLPLL